VKASPQDCSPEQTSECHGETKGCEHPEKLKGKPGDCSPEQIRECHGEATEHPCQ
jgi:hypothetical protein